MSNTPVFFDATGRRASLTAWAGWLTAAISLVLGAAFVLSLVTVPVTEQLRLPGRLTAITAHDLEKRAREPALLSNAERLAAEARLHREQRIAQRRVAAR
ncbi:MAG: hypothetical protein JO167_05335, partial [Alphaproteobacteria bacterium]|nr:hypothetical protein [Alphaproteobacteria bacterium]